MTFIPSKHLITSELYIVHVFICFNSVPQKAYDPKESTDGF